MYNYFTFKFIHTGALHGLLVMLGAKSCHLTLVTRRAAPSGTFVKISSKIVARASRIALTLLTLERRKEDSEVLRALGY